jgi:hypothetical protein
MRQNMLEAYEQGYLDGLREAHAELLDGPLPQVPDQEESSQPEVLCHPGYRAGFSEGLRDGTEVLRELGKTSRLRQI